MGIQSETALYSAIFLVVLGNGFFKPNISTLLGNLYNAPEFKANKDTGYNIFYMGINVGAFICNFFGAAMKYLFNWQAAFTTAGVGMFIGVLIFWLGNRHYEHADVMKPATKEDMPMNKIVLLIFVPAVLCGIIGYNFPAEPILQTKSTDAFLFACLPIIFYYVNLWRTASSTERRPLAAMLAIFFVSIAFWAVFKQNGAALTTWADNYTDRSLPAFAEAPASALRLTKEVTSDSVTAVLTDAQFRPVLEDGKPVEGRTQDKYLKNLPADQHPAPGKSLKIWATNLSQSINPMWVILLTPVVVGIFAWLRKRKREPSTPTKLAIGLVVSALSMLCMIGAVAASQNGILKASPLWLIGTYMVLTIGELCLSPIGLSLVSKLSPPRMTALMMGGWFLATSIGNKMAGVLSSLWDTYDDKHIPWMINMALLGGAAVVIFAMLRWLNRIFREHVH
jgi:proton-dependent oligopeptide transporter, POT family